MSKNSTASSSSSAADASAAWKDTTSRAELIIAAFEHATTRHNDPDLLTRWIAHQLSEVIQTADQATSASARDQARVTATELVSQLWRHRSQWPDGWPPQPAGQRLAQLEPRRASRADSTPATGSAWIDRVAELTELSRQELRIWWQIGLLETGVEDQRNALSLLPEDPDPPTDVRLLHMEVDLHDQAAAWAKEEKLRSRKAIRERAAEQLAELAHRRAELLAEVVKSTGPKRSRAKPASTVRANPDGP